MITTETVHMNIHIVLTPAQLTTALTGAPPNFSSMSSAADTSASDVTSVGENMAPMDAAASLPLLEERSAITTLAAVDNTQLEFWFTHEVNRVLSVVR